MADKVQFKFGDKVKDKFTDLEGIIIGFCQYYNGCNKIGIQARELKDGKSLGFEWLDEEQVELVEASAIKISDPEPSGGPMQAPT